jgi:hypothetical protein
MNPPQPWSLAMLQNPSIQNGKKPYFVALGLKVPYHSFSDLHPFTHSAKAIGTFRLYGAHGRDVFLRK